MTWLEQLHHAAHTVRVAHTPTAQYTSNPTRAGIRQRSEQDRSVEQLGQQLEHWRHTHRNELLDGVTEPLWYDTLSELLWLSGQLRLVTLRHPINLWLNTWAGTYDQHPASTITPNPWRNNLYLNYHTTATPTGRVNYSIHQQRVHRQANCRYATRGLLTPRTRVWMGAPNAARAVNQGHYMMINLHGLPDTEHPYSKIIDIEPVIDQLINIEQHGISTVETAAALPTNFGLYEAINLTTAITTTPT